MQQKHVLLIAIMALMLLASCSLFSKDITLNQLYFDDGITYKIGSAEPYNGKALSIYSNGKLKSEMYYKAGKINGTRVVWYQTGNKKSAENFVDGKLKGLAMYWHNNGKVIATVNY